MIKLITPPGMLFATALLAIYCVCAVMIGLVERSLPLQVAGLVALIATYGVAMVKAWSRYLVYALTAALYCKLGISLYDGHRSGFFALQYDSAAAAMLGLLPTAIMATLFAVSCVIVRRQFALRAVPVPSRASDTLF